MPLTSDDDVKPVSWKSQVRLHRRGRLPRVVVVGRVRLRAAGIARRDALRPRGPGERRAGVRHQPRWQRLIGVGRHVLLEADDPVAGQREAHAPHHGVRGEEGEVRAGVSRAAERVDLALRPVLRVAEVEQHLVPGRLRRVRVDRGPRGVRSVVALALHEADHRQVAVEQLAGAGARLVGPVE